jgi:hypothetical protein
MGGGFTYRLEGFGMGNGLHVAPVLDYAAWRDRLAWHMGSFAERSGGARPVEAIEASIEAQETQCWVVLDATGEVYACALTYIAQDAAQTCIVLACAGKEFELWLSDLLATINAWRIEYGSLKMEVHARPGWEKFLKAEGMKKTHVIMEYA